MPILPPSRSIRVAIERALFWLLLTVVLAAPFVLSGALDALSLLLTLAAEIPSQ